MVKLEKFVMPDMGARNKAIYRRWKAGESFADIGRNTGLTRQRIRAIVAREKEGDK